MAAIRSITIEATDPAAANAFYDRAFGLGDTVRTRPRRAHDRLPRVHAVARWCRSRAPSTASIGTALDAGATTLKPAKKSFWGYGGVVQAPDGTIWKVATSAKKDTGPATRDVDNIVLLLGVIDVRATKQFYVNHGLTVSEELRREVRRVRQLLVPGQAGAVRAQGRRQGRRRRPGRLRLAPRRRRHRGRTVHRPGRLRLGAGPGLRLRNAEVRGQAAAESPQYAHQSADDHGVLVELVAGVALGWGGREQGGQAGVTSRGGDVAEVGGPTDGAGVFGSQLVLDEQRGQPTEQGERLDLATRRGRVVAEHGERVLQQVDPVGTEGGAAHDHGRQPRVAAHDLPSLMGDGEQVGLPVSTGRRQVVRLRGAVGHQVEQVLAIGHVAVQRGGAGAQDGRDAAHGYGLQALAVGQFHCGCRDLGATALAGRPIVACSGHIQITGSCCPAICHLPCRPRPYRSRTVFANDVRETAR